jgi:hypothetical protein
MNLSLTLQTVAKAYPDRPAIAWDGGVLGYGAGGTRLRPAIA